MGVSVLSSPHQSLVPLIWQGWRELLGPSRKSKPVLEVGPQSSIAGMDTLQGREPRTSGKEHSGQVQVRSSGEHRLDLRGMHGTLLFPAAGTPTQLCALSKRLPIRHLLGAVARKCPTVVMAAIPVL